MAFMKHFLAKALQRDDSLRQSRFQGIDDDDLTMKSIDQLTAGPQECLENDDTLKFMKTKLNLFEVRDMRIFNSI